MNSPCRFAAICAALILFAGGCASVKKSDRLRNAPNVPKLVKVWQVSLGIGARIQPRRQVPVEDGEHLFVCDANRVIALSLRKGRREWITQLDYPLTGCLALFADQLYAIDKAGFVYALNKEDGSILWQSQINSESFVAPSANADVLLIQTADEKLQALNPYDGELLWIYDAYGPRLSVRGGFSPILLGPYAIAGFADGSLVIIDWRSGNVVSFRQLAVPTGTTDIERLVDIDAALFGESNILYLSAHGGSLIAVNLADGSELWRQNFGGSLPLTGDPESIYGIDSQNDVFSFHKRSGEILWQVDTPTDETLTGIAVSGSYVYTTNEDGYLSVLSRQDGELLKRSRLSTSPVEVLLVLNDGEHNGVITLDKEGFIGFFSAKEPRD